MKYLKIHKEFSLNGTKFRSESELIAYSKTISSSAFYFLSTWFDNNKMLTVQTSGSTGVPKSIQLKKEHMYNSAMATGSYFNILEGTKALLCLSTDYIAGKMMLVRALTLGWQVDLIDPGSKPLKDIQEAYDFCAMVPLQVYNSLDKMKLIKKLIVGGGAVSNDLLQKISTLNTEVFATYGMTETSTHIAVKRLNTIEHIALSDGERSLFTVLPNIQISTDERGCLMIEAPSISDTIISTNDLVEIIATTQFRWLGRYDNIINSGGIKLIPEQIEQKLASIIDKRFFVAGVGDPILGEKLVLIIESKEKKDDMLTAVKLLKSLKKYEIPKEIYMLNSFIETDTNKVHRIKTLATVSFS